MKEISCFWAKVEFKIRKIYSKERKVNVRRVS